MSARNYARPLLSLVLLTLTVCGLINVYGDNSDVQGTAEEIACSGQACSPKLIQLERTVLAQTFTFDTHSRESRGAGGTAVVKCQRQFIFVGGYSCHSR